MGTPKKGRVFLLKEGDGTSPETFVTVAGLRPTAYTIDGESVDTSDKDGNGWRDLLDGGGITSMSITASGIFEDSESTQSNLRSRAIDKSLHNYQIDDGEDILEGAFQVTSFEASGEHDGEQTFSVTLESAGEVSVTAAP